LRYTRPVSSPRTFLGVGHSWPKIANDEPREDGLYLVHDPRLLGHQLSPPAVKRFYRPDVIAHVLDTLDPDAAVREADSATGRKITKTAPIASLLTPVVQVRDPADGTAADRPEFGLTYSARMPTQDPNA
jgi:hypothetical protein